MHRFEELDVWKVSTGLSTDIYRTLSSLKDFSFRDQISRSGLSIPSNIAEGYERESIKEIVRFLRYAKGSAGELRTQIYIGMNAGHIEKAKGSKWLDDALRISAMISAMIRKFKATQESR